MPGSTRGSSTPGIHAQARDPLARQIAWVREAAIEPYALDGLALNDERVALDLSCGEGRLAHRLLEWGAKRVLAVSDDPEALHRARLLRKHFAIDPGELELRPAARASSRRRSRTTMSSCSSRPPARRG